MTKYTLLLFFTLIIGNLFAQEVVTTNENPLNVSCNLVSRYVWRGSQLSDSPNIQPGLEYSKNGFSIGAWGSYAMSLTGVQEADFYIGYTYNDTYSITITDYYFPDATIDYKYFDYDKDKTGHVLEVTVAYNGTDKLPLKLMLASNFYGADARRINDDGSLGNIMFSTYAETTYSFKYFDAFMGVNLTSIDTDKGESGFYGNGVGVVNFGISTLKNIEITDKFSLPLSLSIITNPQAEKIFFVVGLSF